MKKNIVMIACFTTTFMSGMNTNFFLDITNNSLSIVSCGTKITVIKESLSTMANKVDRLIVGAKQQNTSAAEGIEEPNLIGTIVNTARIRDNDSASDDDNYKPYPYRLGDKRKKPNNIPLNAETTCIVNMVEPYITAETYLNKKNELTAGLTYTVHRKIKQPYTPYRIIDYTHKILTFHKKQAILEASQDLMYCYQVALNQILCNNSSIIALSTLGADVGFPRALAAPIAITTVLEWVKEHPQGYNNIHFVVKKRSDFALYKKLLFQQCLPMETVLLLYCAHNDPKDLFSYIPHDVIRHITFLSACAAPIKNMLNREIMLY